MRKREVLFIAGITFLDFYQQDVWGLVYLIDETESMAIIFSAEINLL